VEEEFCDEVTMSKDETVAQQGEGSESEGDMTEDIIDDIMELLAYEEKERVRVRRQLDRARRQDRTHKTPSMQQQQQQLQHQHQ